MRRGAFRDSQLTDEVDLFQKVTDLFRDGLTGADIDDATSQYGVSHATALLYMGLCKRHQEFIDTVHSYPTIAEVAKRPTRIMFIPGMFYKEHPDLGADGLLVRNIAEKFGFETELVPTLSRGSVADNAEIVLRAIRANVHDNIWIVSLSKGSTEVREALEVAQGQGLTAHIQGWINIGGLVKGTPIADRMLRSFLSRCRWYLTLKVLRINYAALEQTACRNTKLQKELQVDSHIKIIHIAGFPLLPHVEPFLIGDYKSLAQQGPNDGIILLKDLLDIPGKVYPLWGVDHFLRTSDMSAIIYRMCHYINNSK